MEYSAGTGKKISTTGDALDERMLAGVVWRRGVQYDST